VRTKRPVSQSKYQRNDEETHCNNESQATVRPIGGCGCLKIESKSARARCSLVQTPWEPGLQKKASCQQEAANAMPTQPTAKQGPSQPLKPTDALSNAATLRSTDSGNRLLQCEPSPGQTLACVYACTGTMQNRAKAAAPTRTARPSRVQQQQQQVFV